MCSVLNGSVLDVVCAGCGHVSKENRKTQAQFACVESGFPENADLVGAINVRRAGHARIGCQVNCDRSVQQQEPSSILLVREGRMFNGAVLAPDEHVCLRDRKRERKSQRDGLLLRGTGTVLEARCHLACGRILDSCPTG